LHVAGVQLAQRPREGTLVERDGHDLHVVALHGAQGQQAQQPAPLFDHALAERVLRAGLDRRLKHERARPDVRHGTDAAHTRLLVYDDAVADATQHALLVVGPVAGVRRLLDVRIVLEMREVQVIRARRHVRQVV